MIADRAITFTGYLNQTTWMGQADKPNQLRVKRHFIPDETGLPNQPIALRRVGKRLIPGMLALVICGLSFSGQEAFAQDATKVSADAVVSHYQKIVSASYRDALVAAESLRSGIAEFLAAPDEKRLAAARVAWTTAHVVYSATEPYRFYDGPIDNGITGVETRLNGWPMDEAYVDSVAENPTAGIINDPVRFPWLDATSLAELNARGGDKNVATGFHAIEFLLWGQDTNPDGPGARSWKDYVAPESSGTSTAPNPERRAKYLKAVTDLLINDLTKVALEWDAGNPESYAKGFLQNKDGASLIKIFTGIGRMAGDELAGERLFVSYDTGDQENEQSCFSDTTHLTLIGNLEGIRNVYLGTYRDLNGPSLSDLVRQVDPATDDAVREAIDLSRMALEAIPAPLDQVITAKREDPVRQKLVEAVDALEHESRMILKAASVLGLKLNLNIGVEDPAR